MTAVSADNNFSEGIHFFDKSSTIGPVYVSRLLHLDASRTTAAEATRVPAGGRGFMVESVIEHRL